MRVKHFLFIALVFVLPWSASAATLFVSPSSGSYEVGDTITAKVAVSSDVSVNAVSAALSYSTDTLSVTSISKSNSFLSFWAQEPTYSNSAGTADLEGVSLGGGYSGSSGTVVTVSFRAKATGKGTVSFRSGAVLANDGQGTNVTEAMNGASFTISGAVSEPEPEEVPEPALPPSGDKVTVYSSTHPDSSKWYDNDAPRFYWTLPTDASAVRLLLDDRSNSTPSKTYEPAISSRVVEDLPDGTYYFHLQVRTSSGWGAVSHFKVNIDTTQPESFSIIFPHGSSSVEPQPIVLFNTKDGVSGISHYEIKVGQTGPLRATAPAVDSNPYTLPLMEPGRYVLQVIAYDAAGNATTAESEFTVEGIESPKITDYPQELTLGDLFEVRGTSYPGATIELTIYDDENKPTFKETGKVNSLGDFTITLPNRLPAGEYTFALRAIDVRGARSVETTPVEFSVSLHLIADVLAFVTNYFVIVLIVMAAIGLVAAIALWGLARLLLLRNTLHKEVTEAETTIKKSFAILKGDLAKHIKRLHAARRNRPLTEDELMFLEDFEKDLEEAERIIKDEVDDIPKS